MKNVGEFGRVLGEFWGVWESLGEIMLTYRFSTLSIEIVLTYRFSTLSIEILQRNMSHKPHHCFLV